MTGNPPIDKSYGGTMRDLQSRLDAQERRRPLPSRLAQGAEVSDWNLALSPGWYWSVNGANQPGTGDTYWVGETSATLNTGTQHQLVQVLMRPNRTEGMRLMRLSTDGGSTWTAWVTLFEDTGWVTSGVTITPQSGWTISSFNVRRVNNHVTGYVNLTRTGATITAGSDGNFADVPMFTMPSGWQNLGPQDKYFPVFRAGVGTWWGRINHGGGSVNLTHGSYPSQALASGSADVIAQLDYYIN